MNFNKFWSKRPIVKREGDRVYVSVVFTWHLPDMIRLKDYYEDQGKEVIIGGPAAKLYYNLDEASPINFLNIHNPYATFTSRGCPESCNFCAVPKIEGPLRELRVWEPKSIICDNNFLACSKKHFDGVIDKLKSLEWIDFNQGLDAKYLTDYHISRITELKLHKLRLAWDDINDEVQFMDAAQKLIKARIPKRKTSVYVLIGFTDTPEDALYRLKMVKDLGFYTTPMRYQPLDCLEKNSYVGKNWTNELLTKYMRYWSNRRIVETIPFEEFDNTRRGTCWKKKGQLDLFPLDT